MLDRPADNLMRPLPTVRGRGHAASAAVFGLAAVLMLSAAHLATIRTAGSLPMARGVAWVAAPPGGSLDAPSIHRSTTRGAFWAGLPLSSPGETPAHLERHRGAFPVRVSPIRLRRSFLRNLRLFPCLRAQPTLE